jgi:hypothetical protein
MWISNQKLRWLRSFSLCAAVCVAAFAMASPAAADYRRSCHFVFEANPVEEGFESVTYSFRVFNTVRLQMWINDARRGIRKRVFNCIRAHWNDRNEIRPYACQDWEIGDSSIFGATVPHVNGDMSQYPFANMFEEIRQDICNANPDELGVSVNLGTTIRGQRGCLERHEEEGVDPAVYSFLESNFRFSCPGRIGEGGGSEVYEEPSFGEGSDSEVYEGPSFGEGSDSEVYEDPTVEEEEAEEPEASFDILPNIRLPGNDLSIVDVADGDWQACLEACAANDACGAWTYRNRYQGVQSVCLLKYGASLRIPDTCCRSGIRE